MLVFFEVECAILNLFFWIEQKFLEHDFLLEKLSRVAPLYIVMEGSEPPFFTRFFKWEAAKCAVSFSM